jgi:hypothetical protein
MKRILAAGIVVALALLVILWIAAPALTAGSRAGAPEPAGTSGTALTVALYPYFDDVNDDGHTATIALLKEKYHERYPDDDVEIFISPDMNPYMENSDNLSALFAAGAPDLAEVEQTELDNLIAGGYIRPFPADTAEEREILQNNLGDVVGPYRTIGIQNGSVYFIPTWLCALYTFSRVPSGTAPEAADFSQSTVLPDLYLSAYASMYGTDPTLLKEASHNAAAGSPDPAVIASLSSRISACTGSTGENRCLDGYYSGHGTATDDFGAGITDRYSGYSETLYWILREHPEVRNETLAITGTSFGRNDSPSLAWVDGFVINNYTDPKKIDQALRFVNFYNSVEAREIIALAKDTGAGRERVPRYLLPASESFYRLEEVSDDPYYRQFSPVIRNMTPFPTGGLRGNMMNIYCPVIRALNATGLEADLQPCASAARPLASSVS